MKAWNEIIGIDTTQAYLSSGTITAGLTMQARIDALVSARAEYDAYEQRAKDTPLTEIASPPTPLEYAQLLQQELAIRNDLPALYDMVAKDWHTRKCELQKEFASTKQSVYKALVGIGYNEFALTGSDAVARHPSVKAIAVQLQTGGLDITRDWRDKNAEHFSRLSTDLQRFRARGVI